jgi:hypothetical protein
MESLPPITGKGLTPMMDQRTKERIVAEESARFIDSQFAQLDLSGSPDLNHPLVETLSCRTGTASTE